jgi:heptosyltransferase-2
MSEPEDTPLDEQDFHNILLWMPSWIGDVILVLPSLQALRDKFPHSRITAVAKAPADQLLQSHPAVDTVMQVPAGRDKSFLAGLKFAWKLRKYQFDLGVVFPNSFHSALLLSVAGAKNRLGFATDCREVFLTHSEDVTALAKRADYRVDYFFNLLSALKLNPDKIGFLPLNKNQEDNVADAFLEKIGWLKSQFLIALHPGTSKPQRGWHVERFGILCQKLVKEHSVKIILLGQENEKELLAKIQNFAPDHVVPLPGNMNLREVAALLERCDLFIGNDSGMMHLAGMVNTPVVAIFGPGSPLTSGPYMDSEKLEIVSKNFDCSPCRQKFFKECKPSSHNKPFCLEDITVKDVAQAVERLLKTTESKKAAGA